MSKNIISCLSDEAGIIEAIDNNDEKIIFAVCKDGQINYAEKINLESVILEPVNRNSDLIKNEFIILPPKPIEYEDEEELFDEICDFISDYFSVSERFREIAALYAMLTWVYERFNELPYLRVIGTLGTGKSRFLKVMAKISYHPMMLGSASVSAIFRTINEFKGTFILDEADFRNSEFSSDVAKILNNGYSKGMPIAKMRGNSKGEFVTDIFEVFGPKILASRETFNDAALESRCVIQRLYPRNNINKPISLDARFDDRAKNIRGKLLMFRLKQFHKIIVSEWRDENIKNLRILQIIQPLWNIGKMVGDDTVETVVSEARSMDASLISNQADTQEADVLISIVKLSEGDNKRIHMKDIAEKYNLVFGMKSEFHENHNANAFDQKLNLSSRKIGEIVGKVLHLRKFKDRNGVYVRNDKNMKKIIEYLRVRYGITDDVL